LADGRLNSDADQSGKSAPCRLGPSSVADYCGGWTVGDTDTTPAGRIIDFDCHGNALTHLDVRGLAGLEYLDCCFNNLTEFPLDGLTELQALDANNNKLTSLNVCDLKALRVLNCAPNRIAKLDLAGLTALQILDCSENWLTEFNSDGCASLREVRNRGNPIGQRRDSKTETPGQAFDFAQRRLCMAQFGCLGRFTSRMLKIPHSKIG
jgi:hypothetical protein